MPPGDEGGPRTVSLQPRQPGERRRHSTQGVRLQRETRPCPVYLQELPGGGERQDSASMLPDSKAASGAPREGTCTVCGGALTSRDGPWTSRRGSWTWPA